MNTDIRLSVGFWQHPKTKKTVKRLGLEGIRSLQVLWLWAAVNRPDGNLAGMDAEDIELAADWKGNEGEFCAFCLGVWIDEADGGYALHDWAEHNSWQAKAKDRSESARKNANVRWGKEKSRQPHQVGNAPSMPSQCEDDANAMQPHQVGNAPSPSPSPKPKGKEKDIKTPCQVFAEDSDAYRLAAFMLETLKANLPTLKEPNLQKWASDFDVAIRNDPRMKDIRFVAQVIKWACSDDFWKANIQCPGKLRDKFDQLTAKMEATRTARASPSARLGPSRNGNTFPDGRERDYGESDFGALGGTP